MLMIQNTCENIKTLTSRLLGQEIDFKPKSSKFQELTSVEKENIENCPKKGQ